MTAVEVLYPVTMLSVPHLLFLGILIPLAAVLGYVIAKKYGFTKAVIWIVTVLCILCEIEKMNFFVQETEGGFRLPANHLPLNMCPFQIILLIFLSYAQDPKKYKKMISYMYPALIGGAFIGMFIPSAANYYHGLLEFATYRYFFFHSVLMFFGFYLYFSKPIDFNLRSYGASLSITTLMVFFSIWINGLFGWDPEVNHMFVVRPPLEGLPILNTDSGWGAYVIRYSLIGVIIITICYLPAIIKETPEIIKRLKKK